MLRTMLLAAAGLAAVAAAPACAQLDTQTGEEAAVEHSLQKDLLTDPATQAVQASIDAQTAAAVDAAARAEPDVGPKVGMLLETTDDVSLGQVVALNVTAAGGVDSIMVLTGEDALYRVPVEGLTFHCNTAITTRKQSEFAALPRVQ